EDYDDVKAALMSAVADGLRAKRPTIEKMAGVSAEQAAKLWQRLIGRIRWFRLAALAGKATAAGLAAYSGEGTAGAAFAASGVSDAQNLLEPQTAAKVLGQAATDIEGVLRDPEHPEP